MKKIGKIKRVSVTSIPTNSHWYLDELEIVYAINSLIDAQEALGKRVGELEAHTTVTTEFRNPYTPQNTEVLRERKEETMWAVLGKNNGIFALAHSEWKAREIRKQCFNIGDREPKMVKVQILSLVKEET